MTLGDRMRDVRQLLTTAGLTAALLAAPVGAAWAATPSPDPSATASPSATPSATPSAGPSATASASPSPVPTAAPGATASPDASQPPAGTTDCGQLQGSADGTPGLDPGVICQAGGVNPGTEPSPATSCDPFAASPQPNGVVCIAGGLRPGTTAGGGTPTLPRTGPAPLLPTVAVGGWLVLFGLLATRAGRRRRV
jgi:hypothetical protein